MPRSATGVGRLAERKDRAGQTVHLQVVGKATSGSSGSYSIRPAVKLPGGLHNLEVLARSRVGRIQLRPEGGAERTCSGRGRWQREHQAGDREYTNDGAPASSRKIKEFGLRMVDVGGLYSLMPDGKMQETYTAGSSTRSDRILTISYT
jgi:hypothetical protein